MAAKIEVDPETGCWLWTGSCNGEGQSGYGQVSHEGKTQLVHRVVFRLLVGEILKGFQMRHADPLGRHYTLCCNPDNLEAVPKQEARRRRDWDSARARTTHCPYGHAYSPENSYLDARGFRQCRTCRAERVRTAGFPRPCEIS
ncbi:HNH endonuclease [Streptomyces sp. V4I8]|uniref:HNH endonuclease n=1 Tax=Streptomyces sp. V4I8 TaxID=3156469 RepID=UPI003512104A